ncbi:MAG: DNA repair protein RecN [Lachnospiraceae bacterium]|nr:DNA repair protein RecN [Lachnospiraceae bacterium]
MLESIHVKNLALMEDAEARFGPGLNILTGETGAGKSLLMGSVGLALGDRFDPGMLRHGADTAQVELVFRSESETLREAMAEMDLDPPEDGLVIISRKFSPGRSSCRINGESVTTKQLKSLASELITVHGQHESETLLHKSSHLEILDQYGAEEEGNLPEQVRSAYRLVADLEAELAGEEKDTDALSREQSLAEFECREIEEAHLVPGEDEELERDYRRMVNSRQILEGLGECYRDTGVGEDSAAEQVSRALRSLRVVTAYDDRLHEQEELLLQAEDLLADFNRSISSYLSDAEFDEDAFRTVQDRLDLVNRLKDKYGRTIEEVLAYGAKCRESLARFEDYDAYLEKLRSKLSAAKAEQASLCGKLTAVRRARAKALEKELSAALSELNFDAVDFEIAVEEAPMGSKGADDVEFRISVNPGEPRKPLQNVASGGELSRIMLAVKTVLAGRDGCDALIFDEIDAGISGKTAWKVSTQLGKVSRAHQVICITHLPQIAAMADSHYIIEKTSEGGSTSTGVHPASEEESLAELARLLGADTITEAALENAREMKMQAAKSKI